MREEKLSIKQVFSLAVQHHQKGNFQDAERLYKKILQVNPDHFQSIGNIGVLAKKFKKYDVAKQLLLKALQINPQFSEAYYNLGTLYEELKDYQKAVTAYQKALQINPQNTEAHINLGNVYEVLGDHKKAISCYQKALQINPQFAEAHYNLGVVYKESEDYQKAVCCYEKALQINPQLVESHYNLMKIFEQTNNMQELKVSIKNAKSQLTDNPIINIFEAHILNRDNKYLEAKVLLESINIEEVQAISPNEKFKYYELLSKICDQLNDTKKAFKYYLIVNEYDSKKIINQRYKKEIILQKIGDYKNYFTHTNIKKWNNICVPVDRSTPVFLIGFPRTGTTLLDTILRSHPGIVVLEEKPAVAKTIGLFPELSNRELDFLNRIKENDLINLRKIYFEELDLHLDDIDREKIIIDKLPLNILDVGLLHRIFPESKFIFAQRHPCDCVLSCFMNRFAINDAMASFYTLSDAAHLYNEVMTLWKQYVNVLPLHFKTVKYERVVEALEVSIKPLLSFLGLEWNKAMLDFNQTALNRTKINTPSYNQVIKPLYKQAIGRWKRYEEEMREVLPKLEPWIKEFDYY